jgi:hypothetical protein
MTQHNEAHYCDIQHNNVKCDTQHNNMKFDTQLNIMLNFVMMCVVLLRVVASFKTTNNSYQFAKGLLSFPK